MRLEVLFASLQDVPLKSCNLRLAALAIRHVCADHGARPSANQAVCKQHTVLNTSTTLALLFREKEGSACTELGLRFEATPICCGALMVGACSRAWPTALLNIYGLSEPQ